MALDQNISELHKLHTASQDKYTYFLLAASGASIGFAVQKTEGLPLSWWLISVGLAVVCWALSFWFGLRAVDRAQGILMANFDYLQLQQGSHPQQPGHPQLVGAAKQGVRQAMDRLSKESGSASAWQLRMLLAGAVFFIIWRVLEMYRVTG
ncbi:hypothetical protein [Variovorax soli]|uniref:hypothetical protein n=1 Tax=Variovorax soli TaxID=376815 RepID=UPI000838CCD0|nr:hypothetical protein [Variovorax soli]